MLVNLKVFKPVLGTYVISQITTLLYEESKGRSWLFRRPTRKFYRGEKPCLPKSHSPAPAQPSPRPYQKKGEFLFIDKLNSMLQFVINHIMLRYHRENLRLKEIKQRYRYWDE